MPVDDVARRFETNTHHHLDFDVDDLVRRRDDQQVSVSIVIPARDEEATVGRVVETFQRRLVDRTGLVDEIVVVDADSADRTAERASAAGALVVSQSAVLPEAGSRAGKGEALWKGLAASRGDLVVFVDADIVDVSERFVTGLLGPLLTDPAIQFTKACYDRPLHTADGLQQGGGGRVTELLARPVITTFWPQLSWLAQPLSGEYAGRRSLLETLPFVCGWGVELALLVDIARSVGAEAIAQVDLDRRVHDHQSLDALGRMSTEILQVALDRAGRHRPGSADDPVVLRQPVRDPSGDLRLLRHESRVEERPPLRDWLRRHPDVRLEATAVAHR